MSELTTVYKYPVPLENGARQTFKIPAIYSILHVGLDPSRRLCVWAAVNTNEERTIDLEIVIAGTGMPLPRVGSFIGSVVDGGFVWHVFTGPGNDKGYSHDNFAYVTRLQS